jgi:hypothetical protein
MAITAAEAVQVLGCAAAKVAGRNPCPCQARHVYGSKNMDIPILIGVLTLIGAAVFFLFLAVGLVVFRLTESFVRVVMMPRGRFHSPALALGERWSYSLIES